MHRTLPLGCVISGLALALVDCAGVAEKHVSTPAPPSTRADAASAPARVLVPGAGAPPDAGFATALPSDGGPTLATCGDVVPVPGAPAFEAIKRLATTNREVRILVYGQSQSEQPWWQMVRDWLKRQYPQGNLVIEQHARGGCAAQCLIGRDAWFLDRRTFNRVPEDVFAFHPDLIIFSVFGRHDDFETLVEGFQEGCAAFDDHPAPTAHCRAAARHPDYNGAELLLQTYPHRDDNTHASRLPPAPPIPEGEWDRWMATVWIPRIATRYGARLVPLWEEWGAYLQSHHLKAVDLQPDGETFTEEGNALLARLTERYLCYPGHR